MEYKEIDIKNLMNSDNFNTLFNASSPFCPNHQAYHKANERGIFRLFPQQGINQCKHFLTKTSSERSLTFFSYFRIVKHPKIMKHWCFEAKVGMPAGSLVSMITGYVCTMKHSDFARDPFYSFIFKTVSVSHNSDKNVPYYSMYDLLATSTYSKGSAPKIICDYREIGYIEPNAVLCDYWHEGNPVIAVFLTRDVSPGEKICVDRGISWKYTVANILILEKRLPKGAFAPLDIQYIDPKKLATITNFIQESDRARLQTMKFHDFELHHHESVSCIQTNIQTYLRHNPDYVTSKIDIRDGNIATVIGDLELKALHKFPTDRNVILVATQDIERYHILGRIKGSYCLVRLPCENSQFIGSSIKFESIRIQFVEGGPIFGLYLYYEKNQENKLHYFHDHFDMTLGSVSNAGIVEIWDNNMNPYILLVSLKKITSEQPITANKSADLYYSLYCNLKYGRIPFVQTISL